MIFKLLILFTFFTVLLQTVEAETIEDSASLRVDSKVYFKSEMIGINNLSKKADCLFGGGAFFRNSEVKNLRAENKAVLFIKLKKYLEMKKYRVSDAEISRLFPLKNLESCGVRKEGLVKGWLKSLILQEIFFQENFNLNNSEGSKRWPKFLKVLSSRYKSQVMR